MHCRRAIEREMAGAKTRLRINCLDALHGQPGIAHPSSEVDVEERDQDDAGGNDSRSDEGQCEAIGHRR
jgi:hypothetical protein